jgi:hypothetical protein
MQGVDTVKLAEPVASLNVQITGHEVVADKPSMEDHGLRISESWSPVVSAPDAEQLQAAAKILNIGKKVAILAGQGALAARAEVQKLAEVLGAHVAKALLGKAVLPDDSPFMTGGVGHLGTQPSQWIMQNCDIRNGRVIARIVPVDRREEEADRALGILELRKRIRKALLRSCCVQEERRTLTRKP